MAQVLSFFTTQEWEFQVGHFRQIESRLCPESRKEFNARMWELDWNQYMKDYVTGIRLYLAKEDPKTIPDALKKHRRFIIAHETIKAVFVILVAYLIFIIFSFCR